MPTVNDDYGKFAASKANSLEKRMLKDADKDAHISQIVDVSIPYKAENGIQLNVPTYPEGDQQPTHPSVVYFPEGWNGWKYWMAHTPFPYGKGDFENPHIVVSQDGITWVNPIGISNPIFPQPTRGFYSDVELVYHPIENKLYLFWRYVEASWTVENILVSSSSDGVNWSDKKETLVSRSWTLSPTVVFDGEIWHMWYLGADNIMVSVNDQETKIQYRTATSPYGPWSDAKTTNLVGKFLRNNDIGAWHLEVKKYGEEYHMIICCDVIDLYLATSTVNNELTWKYNKDAPILKNTGASAGKFDAHRIYRASGLLLREGSGYRYKIWYGAVGYSSTATTNYWSMGYTELVLGPPSVVIRPKNPKEQGLLIEGRTDQEATLIEVNARNFNKKVLSLKYNNVERISYELGQGLRTLIDNEQFVMGSEQGIKGRFLPNGNTFYLQVGKTINDTEAVLRISRYQGNANIKALEVHADTSLFKGDIEMDNASKGAILKSPDGSRWRVQVDNDGTLKTTKL